MRTGSDKLGASPNLSGKTSKSKTSVLSVAGRSVVGKHPRGMVAAAIGRLANTSNYKLLPKYQVVRCYFILPSCVEENVLLIS